MGQTNAERVQVQEGGYTFTAKILSVALQQIDRFINYGNTWSTITRTSSFISKVEYFSDVAKTVKIFEHQYTRVSNRITAITAIYYNSNGTEDSRVTQTFSRNASNLIEGSANPFSTTETSAI